MENITRVLETLKTERVEHKVINDQIGIISLLVPPELDCSQLFTAADQDGLVYTCSFLVDAEGLEQHVFQSSASRKVVDDLNVQTLRAIGREDLIPVVLCPLLDHHQDLLNNADANDVAAFAVLGIAISHYGNNDNPGSARDPEVWAKISMQMAEQMAMMREPLGIVLDTAEVHQHLDRYYRLWANN